MSHQEDMRKVVSVETVGKGWLVVSGLKWFCNDG
jgi:hypothetical protein